MAFWRFVSPSITTAPIRGVALRVFEPGAGFGALMTGLVLGIACQSGLAPVVPSGLASPVTSTVVSALPGVARYTIRRPGRL